MFLLLLCVGCEQPKSYEELLSAAKTNVSQSQYKDAEIHLKNAIKLKPDINSEARYLFASVLFEQGDYTNALRFFKGLTSSLPAKDYDNQFRYLLAKSFIQTNKVNELKNLLQQENSNFQHSWQKPLLTMHLHLKQKNWALARLTHLRLTPEHQQIADVKFAYALWLLAQQEQGVIAELDDILATTPHHSDSMLLKAQVLTSEGKYQQATPLLTQVSKLKPKVYSIKILAAKTAIQALQFDTAKQLIEQLLTQYQGSEQTYALQAYLAFEQGEFTLALSAATQAKQHGNKSASNTLLLGTSAYLLKQFESANEAFELILDRLPTEHPAIPMIVATKIAIGQIDQAQQILLSYRQQSPDKIQLTNQLTASQLQRKQTKQALALQHSINFSQIANQNLFSDSAIFRAQLKDKNALAHIRQVLETRADDEQLQLAYIMLAINDKAYTQAKEQAEQWLEKSPNNLNAHNALAATLIKLKQTDQAKIVYEQALTLNKVNLASYYYLLRFYQQQKDWPKLGETASQAFTHHSENPAIIRYLLVSFIYDSSQQSWPDFLENQLPSTTAKSLEYLSQSLHQLQRSAWLEDLLEQSSQSNWTELSWQVFLQHLLTSKRHQKFQTLLTQYQQTFGLNNRTRLHFVLTILNQAGLNKQVLHYLSIADGFKLNIPNANKYRFLAAIGVGDKKLAELSYADLLKELDEHEIAFYQAELDNFNGQHVAALQSYQNYFSHSPNYLTLIKIKALADKTGSDLELSALCLHYLAQPHSRAKERLYLYSWFSKQSPELAIEILVHPSTTSLIWYDAVMANNTAWLYYRLNKLELAKKYIDRAIQLSPKHEQINQTYQTIYRTQDETKLATSPG